MPQHLCTATQHLRHTAPEMLSCDCLRDKLQYPNLLPFSTYAYMYTYAYVVYGAEGMLQLQAKVYVLLE